MLIKKMTKAAGIEFYWNNQQNSCVAPSIMQIRGRKKAMAEKHYCRRAGKRLRNRAHIPRFCPRVSFAAAFGGITGRPEEAALIWSSLPRKPR
jgi:hypothetical protein